MEEDRKRETEPKVAENTRDEKLVPVADRIIGAMVHDGEVVCALTSEGRFNSNRGHWMRTVSGKRFYR